MGAGSQLAVNRPHTFLFPEASLIHTAIRNSAVTCTVAQGSYAHVHKHSPNLQGAHKKAQGCVCMTW